MNETTAPSATPKSPTPKPAPSNVALVGKPTPMMAQFMEIKAANPDCLLFYRMGDFYELFFEDAEIASRALNITLTKRGKHLEDDIPMCGVPVHAADDYLQRLIALGHRVAVCEQLENPAEAKKRGSKSVVRRDVVRLVTPGTITEDSLLDAGRNNYLCAVHRVRGASAEGGFGIAWIDMSTGHFQVTETAFSGLGVRLSMIDASEIILPKRSMTTRRCVRWSRTSPPRSRRCRGSCSTERRRRTGSQSSYGVKTLAGFGAFSRAELSAAAAIVAYVEKTQMGEHPPLDRPEAPGRRPGSGHRSGNPRQSGNHAHPFGRAARQPVSCHRPDGYRPRSARCWRSVCPIRCATAPPSPAGSTPSPIFSAIRSSPTGCRRNCAPAPTCCAPIRGWRSTAAARAIWRRSASGLSAPPPLLALFREAADLPESLADARAALADAALRPGAHPWRRRSPTSCRC